MAITVEAVYENGVLKPAQDLPLQEHAQVRLIIEPNSTSADRAAESHRGTCHRDVQRLLLEDDEYEILEAAANPGDQPRPHGLCAGEFTVPDDFDQPLPEEILRDFEGR